MASMDYLKSTGRLARERYCPPLSFDPFDSEPFHVDVTPQSLAWWAESVTRETSDDTVLESEVAALDGTAVE